MFVEKQGQREVKPLRGSKKHLYFNKQIKNVFFIFAQRQGKRNAVTFKTTYDHHIFLKFFEFGECTVNANCVRDN